MDDAMAVGGRGGGASPWRGREEGGEQREKPTVPLSPKPSPTSPSCPPRFDTTNSIRYSAMAVAEGGLASPGRGKEEADEKGEKQPVTLSPKPSPTSSSSTIAVNRPSPHREFAVIAKQEQAETRFSVGSVPAVSRVEAGGGGAGGRDAARTRGLSPIAARWKREKLIGRAALGFRVCSFFFSLISFSVMASDKTQGWSGDSYYRYKEYRYVVAVNVIVFVYSAYQIVSYLYQLSEGRPALRRLSNGFVFIVDQILAYLLISASSSAASLTEDTQSQWGKDPFTDKAGGSIGMSFLAFIALALSSLVSGYQLYNY